ncbi:MAG: hypothetical protein M1168_02150 [Candidatus Marsarchaeota archaeon]|nr:hypothetical protein [Candidatus Marsarchaeota archaeon]
MKIIYRTDAMARKLLLIYQLFSSRSINGLKSYSQFFGKDFFIAAQIHNEVFSNLNRTDSQKLRLAMLSKEPIKDRSLMERKENATRLLQNLKIPLLKETDLLFKKLEKEIDVSIKVYENKINTWFYKIFGFNLPKKVTMILAENYNSNSSAASFLTNNPIILGNIINENYKSANEIIDVLQHELLHSLIFRQNSLKLKENNNFEEALLDYFAPFGMLSSKVGLIDNYNLEKQWKKANSLRPYASNESNELLPVMKRYQKVCGRMTIWNFLYKNGFKNYINQKVNYAFTK